jgi:hypothetical protein
MCAHPGASFATADDVPSLLDAPADKRGKGKRRKLLDVGAMRKAAASQIRKMADSAAKSISQCVLSLLMLASTLLPWKMSSGRHSGMCLLSFVVHVLQLTLSVFAGFHCG